MKSNKKKQKIEKRNFKIPKIIETNNKNIQIKRKKDKYY